MSRRLRGADVESEGNPKRSKAASLDECIEETEVRIKTVEDRIKTVQERTKTVEESIKTVEESIKTVEDRIKTVEDKLDAADLAIDGIKEKISQHQDPTILLALKEEDNKLCRARDIWAGELKQLRKELKQLREELKQLREELKQLREELKQLREEMRQLRKLELKLLDRVPETRSKVVSWQCSDVLRAFSWRKVCFELCGTIRFEG